MGAGPRPRPGRPKGSDRRSLGLDGNLASQLRSEVQRRIRELIPSIVAKELKGYFGGSRRRRG